MNRRTLLVSLLTIALLAGTANAWPWCKRICRPCPPAPCVYVYHFDTGYFHAPLTIKIGDDPRQIQSIGLIFKTNCTGWITFDGTKYDGAVDIWGEPTGTPAPGVYPPMPCTFHAVKMSDPAGKGRVAYKIDIGIDSEIDTGFYFIADRCEWYRDCRLVAQLPGDGGCLSMALER